MSQTTRRLADFDRAAQVTGKSNRTIRRWVERGHIKAFRVGPRSYAVDLDEVEAFIRMASPKTIRNRSADFGPDATVIDLSNVVLKVERVQP